MLLVILLNDLFLAMLGWDGLGIISFFLIVYYQSPGTVFSGWFTLLMNRIGDSLLVIRIVYMWYTLRCGRIIQGDYPGPSSWVPLLLCLGLLTKRAIFPFSAWLPVAIRAPTPISALVHSSTLVTAGLYLLIRFESVALTSPSLS